MMVGSRTGRGDEQTHSRTILASLTRLEPRRLHWFNGCRPGDVARAMGSTGRWASSLRRSRVSRAPSLDESSLSSVGEHYCLTERANPGPVNDVEWAVHAGDVGHSPGSFRPGLLGVLACGWLDWIGRATRWSELNRRQLHALWERPLRRCGGRAACSGLGASRGPSLGGMTRSIVVQSCVWCESLF